jgi:NitT/TauT family transport system permease protein
MTTNVTLHPTANVPVTPVAPEAAPPVRRKPRGVPGWLSTALWALPAPIVFLALWQYAAESELIKNLPTPVKVGSELADLLAGDIVFSGSLGAHIADSSLRVLTGFAIACALAIPLGIVMGRSVLLSKLLDPMINVFRPIPVTAWAPLTVVIIGIGSRSAIFLILIASFFPVLVNTIAGVKMVPVRMLEAAAMLGTAPRNVLLKVVFPAAFPQIFSGMRIGLGIAWVVVVVGEQVGVKIGLGALIIQAWQVSRTDLIIVGMVVIGLAGFLSDRLLTYGVRAVIRSRPLLPN